MTAKKQASEEATAMKHVYATLNDQLREENKLAMDGMNQKHNKEMTQMKAQIAKLRQPPPGMIRVDLESD